MIRCKDANKLAVELEAFGPHDGLSQPQEDYEPLDGFVKPKDFEPKQPVVAPGQYWRQNGSSDAVVSHIEEGIAYFFYTDTTMVLSTDGTPAQPEEWKFTGQSRGFWQPRAKVGQTWIRSNSYFDEIYKVVELQQPTAPDLEFYKHRSYAVCLYKNEYRDREPLVHGFFESPKWSILRDEYDRPKVEVGQTWTGKGQLFKVGRVDPLWKDQKPGESPQFAGLLAESNGSFMELDNAGFPINPNWEIVANNSEPVKPTREEQHALMVQTIETALLACPPDLDKEPYRVALMGDMERLLTQTQTHRKLDED